MKQKSKKQQMREMEQKMAIKKTMSAMNKYINGLEEQKKKYIEAAKKAQLNGMTNQFELAKSGLKSALAQQKRAEEMLLNFELTVQMKDMAGMTQDFLGGMSTLSREMAKITKNTDFLKVQNEFESAMMGAEQAAEQLEMFMDTSKDNFASISNQDSQIKDEEILKLVETQLSSDQLNADSKIDAKLAEIEKLINKG